MWLSTSDSPPSSCPPSWRGSAGRRTDTFWTGGPGSGLPPPGVAPRCQRPPPQWETQPQSATLPPPLLVSRGRKRSPRISRVTARSDQAENKTLKGVRGALTLDQPRMEAAAQISTAGRGSAPSECFSGWNVDSPQTSRRACKPWTCGPADAERWRQTCAPTPQAAPRGAGQFCRRSLWPGSPSGWWFAPPGWWLPSGAPASASLSKSREEETWTHLDQELVTIRFLFIQMQKKRDDWAANSPVGFRGNWGPGRPQHTGLPSPGAPYTISACRL